MSLCVADGDDGLEYCGEKLVKSRDQPFEAFSADFGEELSIQRLGTHSYRVVMGESSAVNNATDEGMIWNDW